MLLLLLSRFSRVRLCATPLTAAHQASPSLGFSRQEHWSGLPFPSPLNSMEGPNTKCAPERGDHQRLWEDHLGCRTLATEAFVLHLPVSPAWASLVGGKVILGMGFLPSFLLLYQMLTVAQPLCCVTPRHHDDDSYLSFPSSVALLLLSTFTRAGSFLAIFISKHRALPISSAFLLPICALIY